MGMEDEHGGRQHGGQSYSIDELLYLKDSPLVRKPDSLPSIAQWMEQPVEQNSSRRRSTVLRDGETPQTTDTRTAAPVLVNAGMGHFGRRPSAHPEDTVLGPPKLAFTSAHRAAKQAAENSEKRTNPTSEADGSLGDRFPARERWTRDRDNDQNRDKAGFPNGRRVARGEGEGWGNVKARKSVGQEELERGYRNGDRDRERQQKDGEDNGDGALRRPNMGREKTEPRWGRREDAETKESEGSRFGGTGQGWRDREPRDKERDRDQNRVRDRDWTRGGNKIEEDPEWMDTPVVKEKKQAHTQEDFQRWKEEYGRGKKKETPAQEKEEPLSATDLTDSSLVTASGLTGTSKPVTSMAPLEGGSLFGVWGKDKGSEATNSDAAVPSKAKAAPKPSRFLKYFAPAEEPAKATPAAAPVPIRESDEAASNDEEKKDFNRILQMLARTNLAPVSTPQASQQSNAAEDNGARQGGVSVDLTSPPPDRSPPEAIVTRQPTARTLEQRSILDSILAPRPSVPESRTPLGVFSPVSPEPEPGLEQFRRPASNRPTGDFPIQQPPSRNSSAQDALNLQNILNSHANLETKPEAKQRERDFLLALMQQPSRSTPPQMANQNIARPLPENQNLPAFFDNMPTQRAQPQTKGRGLPPGFPDDPRFFAENEMLLRRDAERREAALREASFREASMREAAMQQPEPVRKGSQRLPPGIFPDDPAILQRRNTAGELPRQMTNMGIPSQPVPDMPPYMRNPGMPQPPQDRNIAPPPGFGGTGMRQPPGFGGPQPQMASVSHPNTPFGHPGMGPPPGMAGMYPNHGQNQMPPPGPPHGYFQPPRGFPPPSMGMENRGQDPRIMMGRPEFEQQFGGAQNQPGMNRPGPGGRLPHNMYMQ
ncbi:hypothetical protein GQ43DRAFT_470196 [Delitschia confertaspora ATCC 74209]|uniref:Uncharacterized protein n=1 Tax=Delitschia confertaspora ATCC 74209 TaxID=1513339 RepID=A0A9P4MXG9_9PLEO|nr:hypothetical protein GQ43DRAFT_470196 [Delitschia confertaspora ATCC 74209]